DADVSEVVLAGPFDPDAIVAVGGVRARARGGLGRLRHARAPSCALGAGARTASANLPAHLPDGHRRCGGERGLTFAYLYRHMFSMALMPSTADVFNAAGDPCRRRILASLARREATVGEMVDELGLPQPQVSKHLRVLRDVDLVRCRSI